MGPLFDAFAIWLRATAVSGVIRDVQWLWPICEILHFIGLSLLLGVVGFFDLRLLGLFSRVPLGAAWSMMPWGKAGFGLSALTGVIFFVGAPDQYINNIAFYAKLLFLVLAGANALLFERRFGKSVTVSDAVGSTPRVFKTIAIVSIVCWFFVVYWGRMLPFVGNAF